MGKLKGGMGAAMGGSRKERLRRGGPREGLESERGVAGGLLKEETWLTSLCVLPPAHPQRNSPTHKAWELRLAVAATCR